MIPRAGAGGRAPRGGAPRGGVTRRGWLGVATLAGGLLGAACGVGGGAGDGGAPASTAPVQITYTDWEPADGAQIQDTVIAAVPPAVAPCHGGLPEEPGSVSAEAADPVRRRDAARRLRPRSAGPGPAHRPGLRRRPRRLRQAGRPGAQRGGLLQAPPGGLARRWEADGAPPRRRGRRPLLQQVALRRPGHHPAGRRLHLGRVARRGPARGGQGRPFRPRLRRHAQRPGGLAALGLAERGRLPGPGRPALHAGGAGGGGGPAVPRRPGAAGTA